MITTFLRDICTKFIEGAHNKGIIKYDDLCADWGVFITVFAFV